MQNAYAPDPDPEMTIDNYERSFEQNDDLGLNDMKTEDYGENDDDDLESGKPLQFRPNSNWRGCCAKSRLLMDIGQSGRYLITRETPPGGTTCQTSPNLQSTRKNSIRSPQHSSKFGPGSPAQMSRTRSASPDQAAKQWQFVSRLLLFAFLFIFMVAWSYMLCSMDGDCSPFSRTNTTGKESVFWDQMTTFDAVVESQYSNTVIYINSFAQKNRLKNWCMWLCCKSFFIYTMGEPFLL